MTNRELCTNMDRSPCSGTTLPKGWAGQIIQQPKDKTTRRQAMVTNTNTQKVHD